MSQCKGCGKEITWAKTPAGKNIPLEKTKHAYEVNTSYDAGLPQSFAVPFERDVYISHFLTCKNANDFSGGRHREDSGTLDHR